MKLNRLTASLAILGCLSLAACDHADHHDHAHGADHDHDHAAPAEPTWLLTSAPAGAEDVAQAKTHVKEGDTITIRGRVGGRKAPISEDSPIFLIMDPAVPSCADMEEDHCPTPWDYCCESQESITANNATVMLVGEDGNPLDIDLEANGVEPLTEVVVVGTVAPRPNDSVLTIKATKLYKVKAAG